MKTLVLLSLSLTISFNLFAQQTTVKKIGDTISNFSALDENGKTWNLAETKTEFIVVYFYPAAMTSGCTKQACAYRDSKSEFDKLNTTVVAISGDEVKNLKHFKETYQLNFSLLSDKQGKLSQLFGVPTTKGGSITREINGENFLLNRGITTPRWTFILNKNRKIIYKNSQVNAEQDSKNVKEILMNYLKN